MFLEDNRELLTEENADLGFKYVRQLGHGGSSYVRFQQTFGGLEVIGAQADEDNLNHEIHERHEQSRF